MAKKKQPAADTSAEDEKLNGYELGWPTSQRWNPRYNVPRNSYEADFSPESPSGEPGPGHMFRGRSTRDLDTQDRGVSRGWQKDDYEDGDDDEEEFSDARHWIEALSELYMNQLDNRARWDPRWLNITRHERFEGLRSTSIRIMDFLGDDTVKQGEPITTRKDLASALQNKPADSKVRVIMVSDLSRFVMGALGQRFAVDPEFWFEHLVNSGYGSSDSGIKLKNAVWLNWAERETRFRHRALPGPGQRTEWNQERRARLRPWAHVRWARLGLMHYLGKKGFFEDEMAERLADGRWIMERDVELDPNGLLLTRKRRQEAEKKAKAKHKDVKTVNEGGSARFKTTNVYRPYSTFHPLPRNPSLWGNRDLRVMAPEGLGYWSGADEDGIKTIIMVFDPVRSMRSSKTKEEIPSVTFMPRAMELESYTEDDLWRNPEQDETYLDPPPPPFDKKKAKREKRAARAAHVKAKREKMKHSMRTRLSTARHPADPEHAQSHDEKDQDDDDDDNNTVSSYNSDSDYDEEYQKTLRKEYQNPQTYTRQRDFARKYALTTLDLMVRQLEGLQTKQLLEDSSIIPSIFTQITLDDVWQLLAEMRMILDHLDGDLGADIHEHLLESAGIMIRQNVGWLRSTLQELQEWLNHLGTTSKVLSRPPELDAELDSLKADTRELQGRVDQALNLLMASTGLAQSTLVIDQTSGINKLTELAFFFVPLSFITSVFSMQVKELLGHPPPIWAWALALGLGLAITYFIRIFMRSPSVRVFFMMVRVTILSRYTSASSRSASRRLNSVSTRAIVKFLCVFAVAVVLAVLMAVSLIALSVFVFAGFSLGVTGTSLYFIIDKWPAPSALAPGFVAIAVAAGEAALAWIWQDEILDTVLQWSDVLGDRILALFPKAVLNDRVEDEDLAKEGYETFARQNMML